MHKMKRACRVGNQADIPSFRKQITHCTSFPTFFVTILAPSTASLLRFFICKRADSRNTVDRFGLNYRRISILVQRLDLLHWSAVSYYRSWILWKFQVTFWSWIFEIANIFAWKGVFPFLRTFSWDARLVEMQTKLSINEKFTENLMHNTIYIYEA